MKEKKKSGLGVSIGILFTSTFGQATLCVSLILGLISESFPEASVTQIQSVFTIIYYLMVVFVGITGFLTKLTNKKKIYVAGDFIIAVGGVIGWFSHKSILGICAASVFLGIGFGLMSGVTSALISENFAAEIRARMLGIQSICVNLGTSAITMLGGLLLKNMAWNNIYLFYLIFVPAGLAALFLLPDGPVEKVKAGERFTDSIKGLFTPRYVQCSLVVFLYAVVYLTFSSNISFIVATDIVGYATTAVTLASMFAGIVIGSIFKKCKDMTPYVGLALGAVAMFIMVFYQNNASVIVSGVLLGLCNGIYSPAVLTLIPEFVKKEHMTIAFSIWTLLLFLGQALNTIFITGAASVINDSVSARFAVAAVLLGLVTVINAVIVKKDILPECE